jgi:hypothetical protein
MRIRYWEKEELEAYDYAAMREQDERGKLNHAEKRGRLELAKNLKEMGMVKSDIIKAINLSDEEIDRLTANAHRVGGIQGDNYQSFKPIFTSSLTGAPGVV